jgi:hypothetical protein
MTNPIFLLLSTIGFCFDNLSSLSVQQTIAFLYFSIFYKRKQKVISQQEEIVDYIERKQFHIDFDDEHYFTVLWIETDLPGCA